MASAESVKALWAQQAEAEVPRAMTAEARFMQASQKATRERVTASLQRGATSGYSNGLAPSQAPDHGPFK